tara:strand:+ start:354 stop:866 length:513 start_codon:yes stop_codon:yes gene_type:complete
MGASGSKQESNNTLNNTFPFEEYSIDELIEIGKKPVTQVNLRDMIDPKKMYSANESINKIKSIKNTFGSITLDKNRRLNDLIRYELLLMNYSNKNNEVLKELEQQINNSDSNLKENTEEKYANLNQSRNFIKINKELIITKKFIIVVIFILLIFAIAALLMILRKRTLLQ